MTLSYTALSEEEAKKQIQPHQPGIYEFTVYRLEEKVSQKNNKYLRLELQVQTEGAAFKVFDNLMLDGKMAWKLRHYAHAINKLDVYEEGKLMMGDISNGKGLVRLEYGKVKEDGRQFLEVKDYLPLDKAALDDEIPF